MSDGWIAVHRVIKNHWVWNDPHHFHAWIAMLLEVNYTSRKVVMGSRVLTAERGESLRSTGSWATLFGADHWDRHKVKRFFQLLEQDGMIRSKNERKTLRITIVNYDSYQDLRSNSDRTLREPCSNSDPSVRTNNKVNNFKKEEEGEEGNPAKNQQAHRSDAPPPFLRFFKGNGCYVPSEDHWWFEAAFNRFTTDFLKICIKERKRVRKENSWKPQPCMSDLQPCIEEMQEKYKADPAGVYRVGQVTA